MDKLNPWRVGSATALTAAIISVACVAAVYFFPEGFVYGLFNVTLTGFLVGTLYAWLYNLTGCTRSGVGV